MFLYLCIFIFLSSRDIKFWTSNHATFKLNTCNDDHMPTWILDNKTNLLSHMLTSILHIEVEALGYRIVRISLWYNDWHTEICPKLAWNSCHIQNTINKIGNWWDRSLNASNVFILITCSLFILRDMTSSSNSFQVIECVCQEGWPYETTNYHNLPKSHITIYVHILHLSKHHMYERPKLGSKPF